jgi:hypothetical protein
MLMIISGSLELSTQRKIQIIRSKNPLLVAMAAAGKAIEVREKG